MLITEELFLLLRRDDGKPESAFAQHGYGLAGAVVSDLVLTRQVTVSDDKDPRITVAPGAHAEHPVLATALHRLQEKNGKKLSALVTDRKLNLEHEVAGSLAESQVVRIEEKRALGLVPEKYPVVDSRPERVLREGLRSVLAGGTPRPEDGVLLSILQGLDLASRILDEEKGELRKKDLKRRIEEVSQESLAGHAVAKAVQQLNAAIMTAAVLPAAVAGGS